MKMARIRPSRLFLLSCALSVFAVSIAVGRLMSEVFTPSPPPAPAECAVAPPAARSPTPRWLLDYYGPKPTPTGPSGPAWIDGMDGLWAPPGMMLEYRGAYQIFDPSEKGAGNGFQQDVPADEIWRLNWVAVDWITNTGSSTRWFVVRAYNNDYDLWYVQGRRRPGDNSGGRLTFIPGVEHDVQDLRFDTESLPPRLLLRPGTSVIIQIGNAGDDFFNSVMWSVEKWRILPRPADTGSGGTGGGGGSPLGGGGPYFIME